MRYLLAIILLVLVACSEERTVTELEGKQSIDRTKREITLTVEFVDTTGELDRRYRDVTGLQSPPDQTGFAQWNEAFDAEGNPIDVDNPNCQVYTLKPESLNGEQFTVLGHEILHCIWGNYHD